jgi:hypothetical protein
LRQKREEHSPEKLAAKICDGFAHLAVRLHETSCREILNRKVRKDGSAA